MDVVDGETAGPVFARLYEAGLTEPAGAPVGVVAQLGWGPDGTDPRTGSGWRWTTASINPGYGPGSPGYTAAEDEFMGSFTAPPASGSPYDYTFRFSLDGRATATYCDTDGAGSSAGLTFDGSPYLGQLTVTP
jgi:hypothetical protein